MELVYFASSEILGGNKEVFAPPYPFITMRCYCFETIVCDEELYYSGTFFHGEVLPLLLCF